MNPHYNQINKQVTEALLKIEYDKTQEASRLQT